MIPELANQYKLSFLTFLTGLLPFLNNSNKKVQINPTATQSHYDLVKHNVLEST